MELLIVDTAQIQSYVFGSNRLRENVGASHLVTAATGQWSLEQIRTLAKRHNIKADGKLDCKKRINTDSELDAEVIYSGGGNFVVLFRKERMAGDFIRELSLAALGKAPNLRLVIAQESFDWDRDSLFGKVDTAFKKLAKQKRSPLLSAPLLGLSVTAVCQSTELPAIGLTEQIGGDETSIYPAAAEIHAKLAAATRHRAAPSAADERLRSEIRLPDGANYVYPSELDDLGRSAGESSYIAIVHADGDGMGQRIQAIGKRFGDKEHNRDYIDLVRRFSEKLNDAARKALTNVVDTLVARSQRSGGDRIVHRNAFGDTLAEIRLKTADGTCYLPFRPIVFGGDDVTFVCDGRLGLSLAIEYLTGFEQETANLPDGAGKATACAGIAIAKSHYPFARAYALSEELCRNAKRYRRRIKDDQERSGAEWNGSGLDWHFALSGLSGSIEAIRQREYTVKEGKLYLRPVILDVVSGAEQHSWQVVAKGIRAFQDLRRSSEAEQRPDWSIRRNKVKALRDTLREGSEAVKHFRAKFNGDKELPEVGLPAGPWTTEGWYDQECGYFDAIELADSFIPLREEQDK